jgi:hypothetical protein
VTKLAFLVAIGSLLLVSGTMAQMRPGAKVEKTHGFDLPRDRDKPIPPDSDYPVYPLKPLLAVAANDRQSDIRQAGAHHESS